MTTRSDDDKAWRGPRTVSALVPAIVRPAFKRRAPASAQVMSDWDAIVGPAISAVTQPKRLSAGTLTVACAGPIAMELQHLTGPLIERINGAIGRVVVERLRFTQDLGTPPPAPPPRQAVLAARARVTGIENDELREALERLGAAVLARQSRR